jgi:hypothetical protein
MWYGDRFKKKIYGADAFFTPSNGYSGNIYDNNRKPIGDYMTQDSTELEQYFLIELK